MSLLRFASLLILALWVGGLAVLGGLGAPTIFEVLETHDPASGRILAGELFGTLFAAFQRLAWLLGGLLIVLLILRAVLGPRPRLFAVRVTACATMLAASLITGLSIAPRIDVIRRSVTGTVDTLPATDPRRADFGRLHGLSNGLMLLTLVGGTWLIWTEMKDEQ